VYRVLAMQFIGPARRGGPEGIAGPPAKMC